MTIEMRCRCGQRLRTAKDAAGRFVRCAGCGGVIRVPVPADAEGVGSAPEVIATVDPVETGRRPPARRIVLAHAVLVGVLVSAGLTGFYAGNALCTRVDQAERVNASLGRQLAPGTLSVTELRLDFVCLAVALCAAVAVLVTAAKGRSGAALGTAIVAGSLLLLLDAAAILALTQASLPLLRGREPTMDIRQLRAGQGPPEVIPGRAARIAEEVATAFREQLQHRLRTVRLADGTERRYFLFVPPGAEGRRDGDVEFGEACTQDTCVVLPLGPAQTGGSPSGEILYVPRYDPMVLSPARVVLADPAKSGQAGWEEFPGLDKTIPYPGPDQPPFSFVIELAPAEFRSDGPRAIDGVDGPVEDLYQLNIWVFRGFDAQKVETEAYEMFQDRLSTLVRR